MINNYVYDERIMKKGYSDKGPLMIIPPTTDFALVFSYDRSNKRFDKNFYSDALTDGRFASGHLESFLGKVEKKLNRKIGKIQKINRIFGFLAIFGFAILILFGTCVLGDTDYDHIDNDDYEYGYGFDEIDTFFTFLAGYIFALVFYGLIIHVYTVRKYKKARRSVQNLLDKHAAEFSSMGLRWNLPLCFPQWIELWKDYKGQTTYAQPIAQPQTTYALPIQAQTNSQYPTLPQISYPSMNNQTRPTYQSNAMAQPLLHHQGQSQDSTNYMPPNPINYNN